MISAGAQSGPHATQKEHAISTHTGQFWSPGWFPGWFLGRPALIIAVSMAVSAVAAAPAVAAAGPQGRASASHARALVDQERVKAGCASLRVAPRLQSPAERQSRDQAARDRFGHDGAHGSTVNNRLGGLGYVRWGENVAQFPTAQAAVNFWLASPGHRANMLNCAFRDTGLAVARSRSGELYWTETFGG